MPLEILPNEYTVKNNLLNQRHLSMARWRLPQQALKCETSSVLIEEKNAKEFVRRPENYKYELCSLKIYNKFWNESTKNDPTLFPRV